MGPLRWRVTVGAMMLLAAASSTGCGRAVVIVPRPERGYTQTDTLWGRYKNNRVLVTFRFDTLWRTDTVTRLDTLWRAGTRTIVRVDTLRLARTDTVVRVDTVIRPGTGVRVGAARIPAPVPVPTPNPIPLPARTTRVDTITITRRDTITITRRDTVFRVDTLRLAGRRQLFVPPGQYPPEGQCRIWIHDLAPGRQADASPCNALGAIPAGAFILFHGDAWDFDYDWVEESRRGSVPPEIVALQRRRRP